MIGIRCGAPTVADKVTFLRDSKTELQIMLDIAVDNSKREIFFLRQVKSVMMEAKPSKAKTTSNANNMFVTWMVKKCP